MNNKRSSTRIKKPGSKDSDENKDENEAEDSMTRTSGEKSNQKDQDENENEEEEESGREVMSPKTGSSSSSANQKSSNKDRIDTSGELATENEATVRLSVQGEGASKNKPNRGAERHDKVDVAPKTEINSKIGSADHPVSMGNAALDEMKTMIDTLMAKYQAAHDIDQTKKVNAEAEIEEFKKNVASIPKGNLSKDVMPTLTYDTYTPKKMSEYIVIKKLLIRKFLRNRSLAGVSSTPIYLPILDSQAEVAPGMKEKLALRASPADFFTLDTFLYEWEFLSKKVPTITRSSVFSGVTVNELRFGETESGVAGLKKLQFGEVVDHYIDAFGRMLSYLNTVQLEEKSYDYYNNRNVGNRIQDDDLLIWSQADSKQRRVVDDVTEAIFDNGTVEKYGLDSSGGRYDARFNRKIMTAWGKQNVDPVSADENNKNCVYLLDHMASPESFREIIDYMNAYEFNSYIVEETWKNKFLILMEQSMFRISSLPLLTHGKTRDTFLENGYMQIKDYLNMNVAFRSQTEINRLGANLKVSTPGASFMSRVAIDMNAGYLAELMNINMNSGFFEIDVTISSASGSSIIRHYFMILGTYILLKRFRHMWTASLRYKIGVYLMEVFQQYYPDDARKFTNIYNFDSAGNKTPIKNAPYTNAVPSIFLHWKNFGNSPNHKVRDLMLFFESIDFYGYSVPSPPNGLPDHGKHSVLLPTEPTVTQVPSDSAREYSDIFILARSIIKIENSNQKDSIQNTLSNIWDNNVEPASTADNILSHVYKQFAHSPFRMPYFVGYKDPEAGLVVGDHTGFKQKRTIAIVKKPVVISMEKIVATYFTIVSPLETKDTDGIQIDTSYYFRASDQKMYFQKYYDFAYENYMRGNLLIITNIFNGYVFADLSSGDFEANGIISWIHARKSTLSNNFSSRVLEALTRTVLGDEVDWIMNLPNSRFIEMFIGYQVFDNTAANPPLVVTPINCSNLPVISNFAQNALPRDIDRVTTMLRDLSSTKYFTFAYGVILKNSTVHNSTIFGAPDLSGSIATVNLIDLIDDDAFSYTLDGQYKHATFTYDGVMYTDNWPLLDIVINEDDFQKLHSDGSIIDVVKAAFRARKFTLIMPDRVVAIIPDYETGISGYDPNEELQRCFEILDATPSQMILMKRSEFLTDYISEGVTQVSPGRTKMIYFTEASLFTNVVHGPYTYGDSRAEIALSSVVPEEIHALYSLNQEGRNVGDSGTYVASDPDQLQQTCSFMLQINEDIDMSPGDIKVDT